MVKQSVKYWAAQVRKLVTDDISVTGRHNADDVAVVIPSDDNTLKERTKLISALERAGCAVTSTTHEHIIYVDATAEPLDYPYDDSVAYKN